LCLPIATFSDATVAGVQFKIEPFKHPLKVDPLYGGKQSQLAFPATLTLLLHVAMPRHDVVQSCVLA